MAVFPDHDRVLFADGQELTADDVNEIGAGAAVDAWQWPGYADLLPHVLVSGTSYEDTFALAGDLDRMVFCRGGGPVLTAAGLDLTLGNGFLGIYVGTGEPPVLLPQMRWVQNANNGPLTPSFTAAPAGQKRWDVVQLAIASVDEAGSPRDFKDGVTGALTTDPAPVFRRRLRAAITVLQGTPGVTPALPAAPAAHLLALVLVDDTQILEVRDLTFPAGPGFTYVSRPRRDGIYWESMWGDNATVRHSALVSAGTALNEAALEPDLASVKIKLNAAGNALNDIAQNELSPLLVHSNAALIISSDGFPVHEAVDPVGVPTADMTRVVLVPGPFCGDPTARVLGLEISYDIADPFAAYLAEMELGHIANPDPNLVVLDDLVAVMPAGGGHTVVTLDLRGYPVVAGTDRGPYWGQGARRKASKTLGTAKSIALVIEPTTAPARIHWVKWYFAKG